MDPTSLVSTTKQAAYIEAKKEVLGNGRIFFWNRKSVKQKIDHFAKQKFEAASKDIQQATKLIENAVGSLANKSVRKSNVQEFTKSVRTTQNTLKDPAWQPTFQRTLDVQKLQQQVSNLKSDMAALRETVNGNKYLKETFSLRLTQTENDLTGSQKNSSLEQMINNMHAILAQSKAPLTTKGLNATSPSTMATIQKALTEISNNLKGLNQECSRKTETINKLAQGVKDNPLTAFQQAALYLDSGDRYLSTEVYKDHPNLVAENIVAAGTALLDTALSHPKDRDMPEAKALYALIEKFNKGIPDEFRAAKGGQEFLGKLKQYCQKRADSFASTMETAQSKIGQLQAEIRGLQIVIDSSEAQPLASIFTGKRKQAEEQKNVLEGQIAQLRKTTAINISGKKQSSTINPNRTFTQLRDELETLNKVKTLIK
ncbi:MAG: hypothetical protein LBJ13_01470 [Puniceicoccales bacterium]|jgi:hypothetical protein|nr:hypothetical protein [Puniceicoccales bacterium]